MDVYGFLVYGIMLFPHIEDYVDLASMDTFLAKRDKEKWEGVEVLYVSAILMAHDPPFPKQEKSDLPHRRPSLELG
ncbi:hypothetical protein CR513_46578, partial [Mucuna pruriens]